MIKSQLVKKLLNKNPHLIQKDVENITSLMLEKITSTLENNGRVEIRGFGSLSVEKENQRMVEIQELEKVFLFQKKKLLFLNLEKV